LGSADRYTVGAATAKALASAGVRVVINYFSNQGKAETLLKELEQLDQNSAIGEDTGRFIAIRADVSQRAELIRLVEESVAAMGRLDLVVSNQGWTRIRNFFELDENVDE
jgi:NAD(P)-dependent dehydrogenase (short-subunit alcohol dehydrogenase family)